MGMLKMWCWRNIIRWYKRWQWSQSHQIVCTSVHKMQMIGYILGRHRMLWQYNRLIGHFRRICIGRLFLVWLFLLLSISTNWMGWFDCVTKSHISLEWYIKTYFFLLHKWLSFMQWTMSLQVNWYCHIFYLSKMNQM